MRSRFAHLELESDFIDWGERMHQLVFSYSQRAILIARNNSTSSRQECFGWLKTIALLREVRHRGIFKVGWVFTFAAAVYKLVRLRNLTRQAT
jgi:hypothetical protein